ncbi:MAG: copper homeostasis protein CutC [Phocaeicola sp.]|uniref:copper homeostasis protein CutC n=1 Tax=Phocaeicola sp. TaxID=2773926 RepID=UPI003FA182F7
MEQTYQIEICANSALSCINAQEAGANRVELCAGMPEGGTTPSYGEIITARSLLNKTKLHVIIRPRGGDFLYSNLELSIMKHDIQLAKQIGVDGVVFGCLDKQGNVDMKAMEVLMKEAEGLNVTFHRAFDMCNDYKKALEDIISAGCTRILTSGQSMNAESGIPVLKELVQLSENRIIIMPGCGIHSNNIKKIALETGATEFHFSGRIQMESKMKFRNPHVSMGGTVHIDEYMQDVTGKEVVLSTIHALIS